MSKPFTLLEVLRTEERSPSLRRVVFGGPFFPAFVPNDFTDCYVKLAFGVPADLHPEDWDTTPTLRTFTVRTYDAAAQELSIVFFIHGDGEGVAGPWAQAVQPGERIWVRGPGGAYRPDPAADAHLFVGDEAAIPAIGAALESLPPDARGAAFIEVDGPDEELQFPGDNAVDVHWLHRGDAQAGTTSLLDDAVRAWPWPDGRVQAFVHGESRLLKTVRPYVRERVDRRDLSVSAYWKRGETEEGFRAWKASQEDAVLRPGA